MIPDPVGMIPDPLRRPPAAEQRSPDGGSLPLLDRLAWKWRDAQTQASLAYAAWCRDPGADGYAVFRAAQDRADAAQDELARHVVT